MHRMRAVPQEDQPSWFFLERGPNSHGDPPKSVKVVCVRLVSLTQATPSVHGGATGYRPLFHGRLTTATKERSDTVKRS